MRRPIHEVTSGVPLLGQGGLAEGLALVAVVGGLFAAVYLAARHFPRLPAAVRRRPQVALHLVFWIALAVLWLLPSSAGRARLLLGALVVILPALLWRLGYLLMSGQRGRMGGTTPRDHVMYLFPLWGGSKTPYGKGLDYLSRQEARTEEALARSQLAGLRLLVLAAGARGALALMDAAVFADVSSPVAGGLGGASLGLPRFGPLLAGEPVALPTAWLAVYAELVRRVLKLAAGGHVVVAVLRLAGFHVFRNTYKPLRAESVVDFWNRYFYYFKELLVEFFFFPTFVRWFRSRPRLRMFAATMMAAGVGNMYYHLLERQDLLLRADLAGLWWRLDSRMLYCFLLAVGVYVSMRREQGRRGKPAAPAGLGVRLRRIAGVWTFFGLIHVWGASTPVPFAARTRFFLSLFGL